MLNIRTFTVSPSLPEKLECLRELAFNLRWSWDHETIDLFRRLDRDLWEECYHNPVLILGRVSQDRLRAASEDDGFIAHMERVHQDLTRYLQAETWYHRNYGGSRLPCIAYFSAEFGITESLPNYSGGLGVLSCDRERRPGARSTSSPLGGHGKVPALASSPRFPAGSPSRSEAHRLVW